MGEFQVTSGDPADEIVSRAALEPNHRNPLSVHDQSFRPSLTSTAGLVGVGSVPNPH